MSRCIRCGGDASFRKICSNCLSKWSDMRALAFDHLQKLYGKMSPDNLPILQKHMKRLTNLWKKDPSRFYSEVEPQENKEAV